MSQLSGWIEISHRVGVWWWAPLRRTDSYFVPDAAGGPGRSVCSHVPRWSPRASYIRYVSSVSAAGWTGRYCIIQLFFFKASGHMSLSLCLPPSHICRLDGKCQLTWLRPAATAGRLGWTGIGRNGRRWGHSAFCLPLKKRGLKGQKWKNNCFIWVE